MMFTDSFCLVKDQFHQGPPLVVAHAPAVGDEVIGAVLVNP